VKNIRTHASTISAIASEGLNRAQILQHGRVGHELQTRAYHEAVTRVGRDHFFFTTRIWLPNSLL